MKVPFVDLHAQYLTIKQEIDSAIARSDRRVGLHSRTARGCIRTGMGENAWREALRFLRERNGRDLHCPAGAWYKRPATKSSPRHIPGSRHRRQSRRPAAGSCSATQMKKPSRLIPPKSNERSHRPRSVSFPSIFMGSRRTWARSWRSQKSTIFG